MDNPDPLRDQIYNSMQLKTTHELRLILEQDDHEEWSDTAFEVVRQILFQRTGEWPAPPTPKTTLPGEWESVDWQAVSDELHGLVWNTGSFIVLCVFVAFIIIGIGLAIMSSPLSKDNGLAALALFAILSLGISGFMLSSHLKSLNADRIVARARVILKHGGGDRRGYYRLDFAIRSAFVLSQDGELLFDSQWSGHHTLTVRGDLFDWIEEGATLDIIFLSNQQLLGRLRDFRQFLRRIGI
jgi:hypothetical protein